MISVKQKSVASCLLLSVLTCGIYYIYWQYRLVKNVKAMQNDRSGCVGEMLCLLFVPFYSLYWWYTRGATAKEEFNNYGHKAKGSGALYLILGVFYLNIVSAAIMQSDFNAFVRKTRLAQRPLTKGARLLQHFKAYFWLYLFIIPALAWFLVFCYGPMLGIVVAFKRYKTGAQSIIEAPWIGFDHFIKFFQKPSAMDIITNTLTLSLYSLLTFPLPVIFALMLNEVRNAKFKNTLQTVMYAPHFISMVVLVSMMNLFFAEKGGVVNEFLQLIGIGKYNFMENAKAFPHMYVWSFVWQNLGWNCIIYVAALSSVDPALHEAATLDGASRLQRIIHINIPTIMPTIVITLIMRVGSIMSSNADKVLLMQNDRIRNDTHVLGTYVYEISLNSLRPDFGRATAVGLFSNVVNLILLLTVNKISQKVTETSLF